METLSRDHSFYLFDATLDCVLWADPGECFRVETYDARRGRLQKQDQLASTAPNWAESRPKTNPCTGPVGIRGLVPGDTVRIAVHGIELEKRGFIIHKTSMGICKQMVDEDVAVFATVDGDRITLECGIDIPVRPHIGTLGVAPAGQPVPTAFAGFHGGNMDCRFIEPGSCLYLPVFVEGAALGVGDIHASMGAGELMGTGVEICSTVTLSATRMEDISVTGPVVRTGDTVMTVASADQLQEALEKASTSMVDLLCRYGGFSKIAALSLLTTICDAGICQGFDESIFSVASVSIPSSYLPVFTRLESGECI
jgi:Predicted acetamidase/formamidase